MNIDAFRCMRQGKNIAQVQLKEQETMQEIQICDGKKNHALVLLHGFSSTPAVFRYFISGIHGYNGIYAPLLPGHGESIEAFANSTALQWLTYVTAYVKNLTTQYQTVDLLGLSLGGLLACEVAQSMPLRRLFLLAPALNLQIPVNYALILARVLRTLKFSTLRSAAGNILAENVYEIAYKQTPLPVLIEILSCIQAFEFIEPTCAVELFLGKHDAVVDSNAVAKRFLNTAHTTLHWMNHSAHVLPLDSDYRAIVSRINTCHKRDLHKAL